MTDDFRSTFGELRAYERAQTPDFEALLARAPRASARRMSIAIGTAAIAAAAAVVLLWPRHMGDDAAPLTITQWRAPTDFLLEIPNQELLSELPELNESVLNLEAL